MVNGRVNADTTAVSTTDSTSTVGDNIELNSTDGSGRTPTLVSAMLGNWENWRKLTGSSATLLATPTMIETSSMMPNTRHHPPETSQRDRRIAVSTGAGSRTSAGVASAHETHR